MDDYSVNINAEVFNQDLDDAGWDPVKVDDSDADAAEMFDY